MHVDERLYGRLSTLPEKALAFAGRHFKDGHCTLNSFGVDYPLDSYHLGEHVDIPSAASMAMSQRLRERLVLLKLLALQLESAPWRE